MGLFRKAKQIAQEQEAKKQEAERRRQMPTRTEVECVRRLDAAFALYRATIERIVREAEQELGVQCHVPIRGWCQEQNGWYTRIQNFGWGDTEQTTADTPAYIWRFCSGKTKLTYDLDCILFLSKSGYPVMKTNSNSQEEISLNGLSTTQFETALRDLLDEAFSWQISTTGY